MDMAAHPLLAVANDDPPPFPTSYPQLARLDRSVVCQICKEPFSGPVSISCGHSFCSACIRGFLDVAKDQDKKCPSCNEPVKESSIRRNRALEEITDAWDESRPTLITLTQPTPAQAIPRKRPAPAPLPDSKASSSSSNKRTRGLSASPVKSGSRSPIKRSKHIEFDDDDEEEEEIQLTEQDEAPCPLCQAVMPIASIPMHIERNCPPPKGKKPNSGSFAKGAGNQKSDWKKVFSGQGLNTSKAKEVEMKRITKPNYNLATPAELRDMLSEYDLSRTGDKATLISRVQEWILLYNSNLDTSHPSSLSALRAKLMEAEQARKRDKDRGKDDAIQALGTKEGMNKYVKEKKGEFARLRNEIIERDKKRKGNSGDDAIEIE